MRQAPLRGQVGSLAAREFALQRAPFIAAALALGFLCAYLQHGFVPGGDQAYPLAQVRVPVWHVIWMGVWTGYTMALVGQAAGIFALPYTTSVLQFSNASRHALDPAADVPQPHRRPAWLSQHRTVEPGVRALAVRGRRSRRFDRAIPACKRARRCGAFRFALGLALVLVGAQLCQRCCAGLRPRKAPGVGLLGQPARIVTLADAGGRLTIGYRGEQWTLNHRVLFFVGAVVGVVSSALGLGGAFLIVPFLVVVYKLPMYVVPGGDDPLRRRALRHRPHRLLRRAAAHGGGAIQPEWAWGFLRRCRGHLRLMGGGEDPATCPSLFSTRCSAR